MRAARSLPMPGISRRPASSSRASSCGWFAAMSAPFRYARILNGLSSLISSRSAISRRMREIAALSKREPLGLDPVIENPGAARRERRGDGVARSRRSVTKQTAATAGAADLRRRRAGRRRACDQVVDDGRRHPGGQALAVVPFGRDLPADLVPVAAFERAPHRDRRIPDALEAVEDVAVAVDVPLG